MRFIDLDDFKSVNDGMGHGAGDELLKHVADRVRMAIRPADTVARLGGDEFAVLVEDVPSAGPVLDPAERILQAIRVPIQVQDRDIIVSASIGVASAAEDTDVESLLRDADIAMYCAKSNGNGRVDVFDDSLRKAGLAPNLLTIELTESVLIEHESVEPLLQKLRTLGVGIAIDDFGTGYSSLSYLKRFPVSIIKIDRSFVKELTLLGDHSLVRSIVAIAAALSMQTVAEGVETQDQLDALELLDCELAQGFHLGRPMNADAADLILERRATHGTRPVNV